MAGYHPQKATAREVLNEVLGLPLDYSPGAQPDTTAVLGR